MLEGTAHPSTQPPRSNGGQQQNGDGMNRLILMIPHQTEIEPALPAAQLRRASCTAEPAPCRLGGSATAMRSRVKPLGHALAPHRRLGDVASPRTRRIRHTGSPARAMQTDPTDQRERAWPTPPGPPSRLHDEHALGTRRTVARSARRSGPKIEGPDPDHRLHHLPNEEGARPMDGSSATGAWLLHCCHADGEHLLPPAGPASPRASRPAQGQRTRHIRRRISAAT